MASFPVITISSQQHLNFYEQMKLQLDCINCVIENSICALETCSKSPPNHIREILKFAKENLDFNPI